MGALYAADDQPRANDTTKTGLEVTLRALCRDYPLVSADHIEEVLRSRYERTRDASVQDYRLLLAERETRVHLRREATDSPG